MQEAINRILKWLNSDKTSFSLVGAAGTGKSYTIGAIVLCASFLNKKVLLVSQKEPALDVIKDKIEGYLTELKDDDFKGITYYKNTNKPELRSNISNLRKQRTGLILAKRQNAAVPWQTMVVANLFLASQMKGPGV